jgi:photosystem II stability/assembly factor-like uncharacterized protein
MTKIIKFIAVIITFFFLFTSCEKDNEDSSSDDSGTTESSFDFIDLREHLDGAEKVIFLDENEGWVLGSNDGSNLNALIYTDNGGSTWTTMNTELEAAHEEIKFINSTDGWLIDNYNGVSYTTDKGVSWTEMVIPNPDSYSLYFYATASNSTTTALIARVDNTWSTIYLVSNDTHEITNSLVINKMNFPGHNMHLSESGAITIAPIERTGNDFREIAYSTDNGTTWTYTKILSEGDVSTEPWVCDMSFPDDNTGFFTAADDGYDGAYVYKTTNGGSSWTKISIPSSVSHYNFGQISFADANNGLGIGVGSVHKTTDGGENWTEFTSFSDNYISTSTVSYPTLNHGFILGLNGAETDYSYRIYKYTGQ